MAIPILDGTGSGKQAKVDVENRLHTFGVSVVEQHFVNEFKQRYWMFPFDAVDPGGADDYFIYIKYTGTGILNITDIRVTSTVAGYLEPQKVIGTAAGGTDVDLVNRYLGNTNLPTGTFQYGTDITGLTDDGHLHHMYLRANTPEHLGLNGDIVIPPGQALALLWTAATGILSGAISMYEALEPV